LFRLQNVTDHRARTILLLQSADKNGPVNALNPAIILIKEGFPLKEKKECLFWTRARNMDHRREK
jgi:hypothetical protein